MAMKIRNLKEFGDQKLDLLKPHDVIGHVIIELSICHFLLVVHSNHAFILHRYGDMKPLKVAFSPWCRPKVHCACSVSRDLCVGGPKWPHIWHFRVHIAYSLCNIYGPTMTIKGRLYVKFLYKSVFSPKFLSIFGQLFEFGNIFHGLDINFDFSFPKKAHFWVKPRRLSHRACKSAGLSDL